MSVQWNGLWVSFPAFNKPKDTVKRDLYCQMRKHWKLDPWLKTFLSWRKTKEFKKKKPPVYVQRTCTTWTTVIRTKSMLSWWGWQRSTIMCCGDGWVDHRPALLCFSTSRPWYRLRAMTEGCPASNKRRMDAPHVNKNSKVSKGLRTTQHGVHPEHWEYVRTFVTQKIRDTNLWKSIPQIIRDNTGKILLRIWYTPECVSCFKTKARWPDF